MGVLVKVVLCFLLDLGNNATRIDYNRFKYVILRQIAIWPSFQGVLYT
jgi:hypothetical protein